MWSLKKWIAGLFLTGSLGAGTVTVVDQRQNPYDDKGTHFELPIKSDIPQGERVEIAKDRAAMTLKGWNDEYAITIEPQIPAAALGAVEKPFATPANRPLLSKQVQFKSGDVTAFIEPKEGTDNEFDIDFTLHSKPGTNVFTYKIEGAEQFDFFYQDSLNKEPMEEGTVSCTETHCFDKDANITSERSENVVGSYAVYSKTRANHRVGATNYLTGKIAHIYRPKAIDANGAEVWADLSYVAGILSVTVPQSFLDSASYPVKVDPTFGYTSIGGTNSSGVDARAGGNNATYAYTATTGDTITSYTVYTKASSGTIDTIGYSISAGLPNARISTVATITAAGANWYTTSAVSHSMAAGTAYVTSMDPNTASGVGVRVFDTGASGVTRGATSLADPWADTGATTAIISMYATYTASGGGGGGTSTINPEDTIIFHDD